MKKWIYIAIAIVVILVLISAYNKHRQRQITAANLQAYQQANTTPNGLFGQLGSIWDNFKGDGNSKLSESEAKEMSKKIADLIETESADNIALANTLKAELQTGGWNYIGWNSVSALMT